MENKYLSRKFLLAVGFAAVVVGNYWFVSKQPIPWESLMALAAVLGIYNGANAYQKAETTPDEQVIYSVYDSFYDSFTSQGVEAKEETE